MYGMILRVAAPTLDTSTWRPDLAEGYLAGQAMERQIRRQHRRNVALLTVGLAIVAALLPFEARSVWTFGAWSPWATPHHIRHCGQTYRQESGSEVRSLDQRHVVGLHRVMSGPHFEPVYEPVFALGGYHACGPDLLVRSGDGYRDYSDGLYG
jgi:hypothetical protein